MRSMKLTTVVSIQRGEPYDVYIGRAGRGEDGYFGNPIRPRMQCPECHLVHTAPGDTLLCFERYFLRRLGDDLEFRHRVLALQGLRLGCPGRCTPWTCHGEVIARWANQQP